MNIRFAAKADLPAIKKLWMDCFGEEARYVEVSLASPAYRAAVLEEEGRLCSMLLLFPAAVTRPDQSRQGLWYVYAFCTAQDCRSKGYGRTLLAFVEEQAAKRGCVGVYMVPGEPSLFDFYATLGYQPQLMHSGQDIPDQSLAPFRGRIQSCSAMRYFELREQALKGLAYVSHSPYVLCHQKRVSALSGADLYEIDGRYPAAVECWDKDHVTIKELLMPQELLPVGVAAVGSLFPAKTYTVRSVGEQHPFGVIKWLKQPVDGPIYAGLAFD